MQFCLQCHARFHVLLRQAGISLEYTDDPIERIRRALAAFKIAEWMLLDRLKIEIEKRPLKSVRRRKSDERPLPQSTHRSNRT